jgi:carboxymethylenebutenolidase
MGKRLAGSGYSVLVVNPFYRVGKPTATGATPIKEMMSFRKGMGPETDMSDAKTFVAWLDAQPQVNKNRKVGVQGYCMGGPMSFNTASAVPGRIGAVASFHGGGLVNEMLGPNSPHLLAAATKASFLIAIAENDDKQRPDDKTVLKETFDKAKLSAEIEVYQAAHGWCPPDTQVYNEPAAEKAWSRLLALYGKALA